MRGFRVLAVVMAGLLLSACGTVSREAFTAQDLGAVAPRGLSDVRFSAADPAAGLRFRATSLKTCPSSARGADARSSSPLSACRT